MTEVTRRKETYTYELVPTTVSLRTRVLTLVGPNYAHFELVSSYTHGCSWQWMPSET